MARQRQNEQLALQAIESKHVPWTLRLASWAWNLAGAMLVLTPPLATVLLWLQYRSLRKNATRLADLAAFLAPPGALDLEPYIIGLERFEAWLANTSGWLLPAILVLYLVVATAIFAAYALISKYSRLGSRTARVFGTAFSVISSLLVFLVWQMFASISWVPVDALWANHLGLVVIALHTLGCVLVWLPDSNGFVREIALRGSTPSATWQNEANERQ